MKTLDIFDSSYSIQESSNIFNTEPQKMRCLHDLRGSESSHRVDVLHVYKDQHAAVFLLCPSLLSFSTLQRVAAAGRGSDAQRAASADESRMTEHPVTKFHRENRDKSY